MKPMALLALVLACSIVSGPRSYAQTSTLLGGSRIRLSAPEHFYQPIVCTFDRLESDSIFVMNRVRSFALPVRQIHRLELAGAPRRRTLTGAAVGSLLGGLVLGAIAQTQDSKSDGFSSIGQPGFWGGFGSGALLGGGAGALIGHRIFTDTWMEITPSGFPTRTR